MDTWVTHGTELVGTLSDAEMNQRSKRSQRSVSGALG